MVDLENILFLILLTLIKIQKVLSSEDLYETEIIRNKTLDRIEKGQGAYYIAYSPYRTGYTKITSYVKLPTFINTNDGKRTAFISFGIQGKYGYIDMGIKNTGKYWAPYYNDNGEFKNFEYFNSKEPLVKIMGLEIDIISKNKIKFYVSLRDENAKQITNITNMFSTEIYASHIFEYDKEDKPFFRFYRFASLVNNKENGVPDNQRDNTSMINGIFTGLCIVLNYNVLKTKTWGIGGNHIEASWKVSPKNVEFSYGNNYDSFSIKHYK